jgi:hypothetical protein
LTLCKVNRDNRKKRGLQNTDFKIGPDGDIYIIPSTFEQDFKLGFNEFVVRGVYHWNTERSVVYMQGHEVLEDVYSTCIHETIHHCLMQVQQDAEYEISIDDEQEHRIIRNMMWAADTLIKDYTLNYNQALRELVEKE